MKAHVLTGALLLASFGAGILLSQAWDVLIFGVGIGSLVVLAYVVLWSVIRER